MGVASRRLRRLVRPDLNEENVRQHPTVYSLDTVFVARFYSGGVLAHAQTGTLPELAVLCCKGNREAEIAVGDGDALGRLRTDGSVTWYRF